MLVSVVIPAYNAEKYISYALDSVLMQTYTEYEIIVVDDCSTDGTFEIVKEYADEYPNIKLYRNQKNSGVSYSRNFGVSVACGAYIAFLDSDDMWEKEKLQKQVEMLEVHPDTALLFTASSFIDSDGNLMKYILNVPEKIDYKTLLKQNIISCSSVMVKKTYMTEIKMQSDKMHEDFAVWLKILQRESFAYGINEPLLKYRLLNNSKSSNKLNAAKMNWRVYRYVGVGFFKSIYYMLHYVVRSIKKYSLLKH